MQSVSVALQAELDKGASDPRILVDLYELYASDYLPGPSGFDPADAAYTFAAETISWNGVDYRREVKDRSDITKSVGEKTNSVSVNFSNIDRYLATLHQTQALEGMWKVIRCIGGSVTDDSIVEFVGRNEKPGDVDKKSFSLSARQDFGNINVELPPRSFVAQDPNGRTPSDLLYEGFRIQAMSGNFQVPTSPASGSNWSLLGGLIGWLIGRKRSAKYETRQWSSLDSTPYGAVVPMVLGRCQMSGIPIFFADIGQFLLGVWVWGEGRIDAITNVVIRSRQFVQDSERDAFGDPGGTLSNIYAINPSIYPAGQINHGYLSKTAYSVLSMHGSAPDVVDDAPEVSGLIRGMRIPVPNASGVFDSEDWTDNPAYIARFLLSDPRMVGIPPELMEDSVIWQTGLHCDEPLIDDSNGEVTLLPAGSTAIRYSSTGVINTRRVAYQELGDTSVIPEFVENEAVLVDMTDISTTFPINRILRKRYTCNVPITDRVRAVDFLYKVVLPCFKGFIKVNKRGKYEIKSEQPADNSMLRSAVAVADTAIQILDVTPWKSGDLLTGRLLLGFGLTTSEVRNVSSALYSTAGNSITLSTAVTGGITATRSGATLSGGSTTVQASGTVTMGGTPGTGDTVSIVIDGVESEYTLNADDTTSTVASLLSKYINANLRLRRSISASWDSGSPTVITIKAKHGTLNVDSALLKAHTAPIADPTASPVLASSAGSLDAGVYKVAYADVTALGKTALSPVVSITIVDDKRIDVGAIALVGTSRNWYVSDAANSDYLKFVANTNGAAFSINALPLPNASRPPSYNTTGEELIRVAMSFATNSQDIFPSWSPSTVIILNDVYLPDPLNGHKYRATSLTTAITSATSPTWPTSAGGTVVDGGVTWTEIGSTVLQQAGLTRANIVKDTYKWPLNKQSPVNQIKIAYRDANNDFALTPYRINDPVHQAQVHKVYPLDVDGSAIDNFHQMYRIANWQLAKNREGDWFNSLTTGPQGLVLEEGDVICASDDSGGLVNQVTRIEELRIKPNHEVEIVQARKYSTNMFADDVGADVIPIPTTLSLGRFVSPAAMTDGVVTKDASDYWLIQAVGHPQPSDEFPEYECLVSDSPDWGTSTAEEEANTALILPMVTGTRQGVLFAGSTGAWSDES
jgi:hypothetical protein